MIKKLTKLTKALLVAAGLCVGASSAWADGYKRTIDIVEYSSIEATDWSTPSNGTATLKTSSAAGTPAAYSQCYHSGSGPRATYKDVHLDYILGSGYTTSEITTNGYNIEFDFSFTSGKSSGSGPHQGQFIISTGSPSPNNYISDNATCLFSLSYPSTASGSTPENLYINDLANSDGTTISYSSYGGIWLHMKLVVTSGNVAYTLTKYSDGSAVASGNKTVTGLPSVNRFYALLGRGGGTINFTNYEIYDYTAAVSVTQPAFAFKKVDGAKRVYTLTNPNGAGTLYYTTAPAAEAPAIGDDAYTSTTSTSIDVEYSASGTYYAYILHTNGTSTSTISSQAVTAGALTLNTPVFKVVDMVEGADGYFYPQVSFASDNSAVEGSPTVTYNVASPYTFTGLGYIEVTASADGYTSSSAKYLVSKRYTKTKTINFGALTASDFNAEVWTSGTGVPRDYWTKRAAAIPADVPNRKLTSTSNTDNSGVVNGITISNYNERVPEFCIGYGMYTPYSAISGSGNNMNFTVNGATAEDYAIYKGWNNYGDGTFITVQAGNATFGLYRYDTMLRTIDVYSPEDITIIGAVDYTTAYDSSIGNESTQHQDLTISKGEVLKINFNNHGNGQNNYNNWALRITNSGTSFDRVLAGGNHINQGTEETFVGDNPQYNGITQQWFIDGTDNNGTFMEAYKTQMMDANVDMTIVYGADGMFSVTTESTMGGHEYKYVFTRNEAFIGDVAMELGVDCAWLELLTNDKYVTATISDAKYASFSSTKALDFTTVADKVTPFIATGEVSGGVNLKPIEGAVAANTGLVLKSVSGEATTVSIPVAETGTAYDNTTDPVNYLYACDGSWTEVSVAVTGTNYVLAKQGGNVVFAPVTGSTATLKAGQAALWLPASGARALSISFDDEATGINTVESNTSIENDAIYNLRGQRVSQPTKGLYIVGGKKVMVK